MNTSNDMFGRLIWDKLPECIFENVKIARSIHVLITLFYFKKIGSIAFIVS